MALMLLLMCGLLWVLLCLVCSTTATDCEDKSPSWYNSVSVYTSWAFWASPDLCSISLIGSWLSLTATSKPLVLLHKGMPLDQDTVKEAFLFWENANCKGKKHRLKSMRADNSEKKWGTAAVAHPPLGNSLGNINPDKPLMEIGLKLSPPSINHNDTCIVPSSLQNTPPGRPIQGEKLEKKRERKGLLQAFCTCKQCLFATNYQAAKYKLALLVKFHFCPRDYSGWKF